MENTFEVAAESAGLRLKAYKGIGMVMLAFDLQESLTDSLAGFAVECTPPDQKAYWLPNRLAFDREIIVAGKPREWVASNEAPFQLFRWIHVPTELREGTYRYQVVAVYFQPNWRKNGFRQGASVTVELALGLKRQAKLQIGFTRGFLQSQAYARRFGHEPQIYPTIRHAKGAALPLEEVLFNTAPYEAKYRWLGGSARSIIFDFLYECLHEPGVTVAVMAYDLTEPDFAQLLIALKGRIQLFLDTSGEHGKPGSREYALAPHLIAELGAAQVMQGKFRRMAHNKVLIKYKNGQAQKVLTGSTNFSLTGLYVHANNVLVFDDPKIAGLYANYFKVASDNARNGQDLPDYGPAWFGYAAPDTVIGYDPGLPQLTFCFAPHDKKNRPCASIKRVQQALQQADSSVLFAVMQLTGGGEVFSALKKLLKQDSVFSYGVTDNLGDGAKNREEQLGFYKPNSHTPLQIEAAALVNTYPENFRKEFKGPGLHIIHHKFLVIDFNGTNPVVFTGSSNLSQGGEEENGDNLVGIYDRQVAIIYAIEALRLFDHFHWRSEWLAQQAAKQPGVTGNASSSHPLRLRADDAKEPWWSRYYQADDVKCRDRKLFSK